MNYYNIYVNSKSFYLEDTLDISYESRWHHFFSFKTEEEVLQYVRSELYDIYKYYDKDPHTKIWVDDFNEVNCLIRFVDMLGFSVTLIRIEKIKEKEDY